MDSGPGEAGRGRGRGRREAGVARAGRGCRPGGRGRGWAGPPSSRWGVAEGVAAVAAGRGRGPLASAPEGNSERAWQPQLIAQRKEGVVVPQLVFESAWKTGGVCTVSV